MNVKKLRICLLLPDTFKPDFPARPAIMEIYGNCFKKHQMTWLMSCINDCDYNTHVFENVEIILIPDKKYMSFFVRIYYFLAHYYKKFRLLNRIFREDTYDIIQVRNNIWDALLALYIKKKFKIPFFFQYTFPKNAYKFENSPKLSIKISSKLEEFLMRIILKRCDFIFPISAWMESDLIKEGIPESKIMPVPMGANTYSFSSKRSGDAVRKKYDLSHYNVILYVGSLDKLRELETIILAFSKLDKNVKLLVLGDGNDKSNLETMAKHLEIEDRIVFTGQISYFDIPNFIAAADICLSPIPPIELYKISSPTKLFEYMSMGKPVVANKEIPEHDKILKESECGVLVDFNPQSFAEGINYLLNNPNDIKTMGNNGRHWVIDNRSYEKIANQIEEQYYKMIS